MNPKSEIDYEADLESVYSLLRSWSFVSNEQDVGLTILGGGVSNIVVKVSTKSGTWVLKQALPRLRVKDEWLAKPERILIEGRCLEEITRLLGPGYSPRVLKVDRKNFAILIEYAGDNCRRWKDDLLKNIIDGGIIINVALTIAKLHRLSSSDEKIKNVFHNNENFFELRIDPYLITVAKRHPEISEMVNEVVELLSKKKLALVHGDYSPKNILLLPDGHFWIIDPEPAHFGNPVFDLAFCMNHLLLKSIHLASERLLYEALTFWDTYWRELRWDDEDNLKKEAVRTLSCLMLARVDGKSPVEYLNEKNKQKIRSIAIRNIKKRQEDITQLCLDILAALESR